MLRFAQRRATALMLAAFMATLPVLPMLLCLCSTPAWQDGCIKDAEGSATWSDCCCDRATEQPAAPSAGAVYGAADHLIAAWGSSPARVSQIVSLPALASASPLTRTHPLFKLFPAFLT